MNGILTPTKSDTKKGRFYTLPDGQEYPSVTSILSCIAKPALINWAANTERTAVIEAAADLYEDLPVSTQRMNRNAYITTLQGRLSKVKAHTKELAKAGEIGSQVHSLIEWNIRKSLKQAVGKEPRLEGKALWAFTVWQEWAQKVKFTPIFCEQTIFSDEFQYAGTMDLMAELDLGDGPFKAVIDWKTGKAIYDEALLQNSAYVHALIEMGHVEAPVFGLIVRLPKNEADPEPEMRLIPYEEHDAYFKAFVNAKQLWQWQAGMRSV